MPITPGPFTAIVNSGFSTSSAFCLPRGHLPIAILCPSAAASQVFLAFCVNSGTGPFERFKRVDGTGFDYVVCSGTGGWAIFPAVGIQPPSRFARLELSGNTVDARSFLIVELTR